MIVYQYIYMYIIFFQIPAEKSNVTCCVCPDNCEMTYPRKPMKIYSVGIKVFRFYFSIRGPVNKNILNIHLYICVRNSTSDIISRECLQKNPLRIIQIIKNNNLLKVDAEAPQNLTCHHCLIQWAITKGIFLFLFFILAYTRVG